MGTAPRSLARWRKQLDVQGAGSFYQPWGVRGSAVLTVETSAQCQRLLDEGHQTAIIIITARTLASPTIAGRMFSRWCQENYFGYMMEHHDIDGLVQYGSDEIPGAPRIVNPALRELDRQLGRLTDTVKMIAYRAGRLTAQAPHPRSRSSCPPPRAIRLQRRP